MYIKQKDIFRAMNKSFVKKIMNVSTTESYEKGDLLFQQGDLANQFYILLKGHIKLILGETGRSVYIVKGLLVGSVSRKVIHHSSCPVMVVH